MKGITALLIGVVMLVLSCESTGPEPAISNVPAAPVQPVVVKEEPPVSPVAIESPAAVNDGPFDPGHVPQALFVSTKLEVQNLIQELNEIIRAKDYGAWVSYLGDEFFENINSREYLNRVSESTRLKSQKIVLASPEDYFTYVVVPSRADDRVDDIEFITERRIKAYTVNARGQRLRLYELERIGSGWKIIN
jgi:hypothetical protein